VYKNNQSTATTTTTKSLTRNNATITQKKDSPSASRNGQEMDEGSPLANAWWRRPPYEVSENNNDVQSQDNTLTITRPFKTTASPNVTASSTTTTSTSTTTTDAATTTPTKLPNYNGPTNGNPKDNDRHNDKATSTPNIPDLSKWMDPFLGYLQGLVGTTPSSSSSTTTNTTTTGNTNESFVFSSKQETRRVSNTSRNSRNDGNANTTTTTSNSSGMTTTRWPWNRRKQDTKQSSSSLPSNADTNDESSSNPQPNLLNDTVIVDDDDEKEEVNKQLDDSTDSAQTNWPWSLRLPTTTTTTTSAADDESMSPNNPETISTNVTTTVVDTNEEEEEEVTEPETSTNSTQSTNWPWNLLRSEIPSLASDDTSNGDDSLSLSDNSTILPSDMTDSEEINEGQEVVSIDSLEMNTTTAIDVSPNASQEDDTKDHHQNVTKRTKKTTNTTVSSKGDTPSKSRFRTTGGRNNTTTISSPMSNQIVYIDGRPFLVSAGDTSRGSGTGGTAGHPPNMSPAKTFGFVFGQAMASSLDTGLTLWFATWLARRFHRQQETFASVQHFVWEHVNDRYERDVQALQTAVNQPPGGRLGRIWQRQHAKRQIKYTPNLPDPTTLYDQTVIVLPVQVDKLSGNVDVPYLTQVVSFIVQQHRVHAFGTQPPKTTPVPWWKRKRNMVVEQQEPLRPKPLEIVLLVKSPGGGVGTYGLAAAQIQRLAQEPGITLTACVDLIAASGGYMIASQAHKIIAAPFATVGSIGAMISGLNFNQLARKYGVHPIVLKAGAHKNPITPFGAITAKDEKEETAQLDKVHMDFKRLVVQGRPGLAQSIDTVADGRIFLGHEALRLNLVDALQTSDEYIMEKVLAGYRVLELHKARPRYNRRIHLNPLDLPIPRRGSGSIFSWGLLQRLQDPNVLLALTGVWRMGHRILQQYLDVRGNGGFGMDAI
jgi:serine protease SohB